MSRYVFFRNDDIREVLDDSLIDITDLFLKHHIPISHAVEPDNITEEVVEFLLSKKKEYPNLIEIIQHGFDHNLNEKYPLGTEFGANRSFRSQYHDIEKGQELMNKYFGANWSEVMTFPYGSFDFETLRAIKELKYKAISTSISFSLKHKIKDRIGELLFQNFIMGKKIAYHNKTRPGMTFKEIGVSVNLIKKYLNEKDCIHFDFDEIVSQFTLSSRNTNVIGILMHHRFHSNYLNEIENLLITLKSDTNNKFVKIFDLL